MQTNQNFIQDTNPTSFRMSTSNVVGIILAIIAYAAATLLPSDIYGLPGLDIIEQRMVGIFVAAAILWISEAVPTWCTSLLIIAVMLLTVSDSSLWLFAQADDGQPLGNLISYKEILASFADPVIILFLGGFVLAICVSKTGLDAFMARVLLYPFGTRPQFVMLGFILVTALFSAFISDTATTAMMLTFMAPVINSIPADGKGRIALTLAIPYGAIIGGISTPIGTPPNGIALKYLNDPTGLNMNIGFGEWVGMMLPVSMSVLLIAWVVLMLMYPFKEKHLHLSINTKIKNNFQTWMVAITFLITVIVWFTGRFNGVNAYAAAMIPITLLSVTGIFTKKDLEKVNWSVLWLVAGGFALGLGFKESGLAKHLVQSIPFETWSPIVVLISAGILCWFLSNFISNTASAALLIPIICAVGTGMGDALVSLGGIETLLMSIALAASMAMTLPISTPSNALAHSTGLVKQSQMARAGLVVGLLGATVGYLILIAIN